MFSIKEVNIFPGVTIGDTECLPVAAAQRHLYLHLLGQPSRCLPRHFCTSLSGQICI